MEAVVLLETDTHSRIPASINLSLKDLQFIQTSSSHPATCGRSPPDR
jgi:hypothetical protein